MILRPLLLGVALAWSCTPTSNEERVQSALDVLADVVDPSYRFAVDGCIAQERDAVQRFERGSDAARDEYVAIKARCANIKEAFEQIRQGHARAASFVESGKVREAEAELERIRGIWHVFYERDGGSP